MCLFKIRIYDWHEDLRLNENNEFEAVPRLDDGLKTFHLIIDVNEIKITGFRSYTIFDSDNNPTEVTKVFLDDGSFVFAANKIDTFESNYRENYLSLFTQSPTVE